MRVGGIVWSGVVGVPARRVRAVVVAWVARPGVSWAMVVRLMWERAAMVVLS
jgi:hypothetical protein